MQSVLQKTEMPLLPNSLERLNFAQQFRKSFERKNRGGGLKNLSGRTTKLRDSTKNYGFL